MPCLDPREQMPALDRGLTREVNDLRQRIAALESQANPNPLPSKPRDAVTLCGHLRTQISLHLITAGIFLLLGAGVNARIFSRDFNYHGVAAAIFLAWLVLPAFLISAGMAGILFWSRPATEVS